MKFVVNTEGKVESPEVVESVDPELDAEALRAVWLLEGFTPGQVDGKNVNVSFTLPVTFKIPKNKKPDYSDRSGWSDMSDWSDWSDLSEGFVEMNLV